MKQDIIQKFKQDWEYTEDEECFTIKGDLVEPIRIGENTLKDMAIKLPKHMVYNDYEVFWSEKKVKKLIKGLNNKDIPLYVDDNLNSFELENIDLVGDIYSNDE